ncbi:Potassium channel subfamily K member 9 [Armadillidium nasatum]|uniref:Potassium channel subfamily K member 9 n=1 Tax=Armadillidium nasatum TaxID=96803 RepID=A0A5N5T5H1_9CRUS|nr:Potassium channel subfamily K member 9 [Armadillidium nasatum]
MNRYGNIAPSTTEGRAFCIIYGFIGIPVTLTVIADLGTIFANLVLALNEKLKKICGSIKYFQSKNPNMSDKTKRGLIVVGATGSLLIYMSLGAQLFIIVENWSFFEAFYFCFITMTTIGLGDLVPERTEFMLVCTIYILIGLALTSTIIELIRRQYAESWEQMKALSYKLGELSGPLTEQLRRLGNHDMNLALNINPDFKELAGLIQLHRLEALYKMDPKLRNSKKLAQILQMAENEEQNEEEVKKTKKVDHGYKTTLRISIDSIEAFEMSR